jgi:hypothetical protein
MKTLLASGFLALVATAGLSAASSAAQWTNSKEVAQAAREFSLAAERLEKAIHDVAEESPLAAEVKQLSKSANELHLMAQKGTAYEDAVKNFKKMGGDYAHFEAGLKKAHDVHHDKQVVAEVKKIKTAFESLQSLMSSRQESKSDQTPKQP